MPSPKLIALSIGRPRIVLHAGQAHNTAINRATVDHPLTLRADGLEGDRVANRSVHGGAEQAACFYPREHYEALAGFLGTGGLTIPSFGENLTTEGLIEDEVRIGDTYRIGSAVVRVSKPRTPCATLARKHNRPQIIEFILRTGFSGFYLRVIEEGEVPPSGEIRLIDRPAPGLTVRDALRAMADKQAPPDLLRRAAECEHLSADWREKLRRRIELHHRDTETPRRTPNR